ncbi:Topless-related protein 1 [Vitis vinifera]|uniref:Topless-related protein 1 n=1 Tax=Vitis vinifera TaxID=29760 RepID=A0A438F1J3_VITVI|nr:Topless-related protein 1 [Vitis vinifera]
MKVPDFLDLDALSPFLSSLDLDEEQAVLMALKLQKKELIFLILQFLHEKKYTETVHKHDDVKALEILKKDLKVFASDNESLFKEMTQLLALNDFREMAPLSTYKDAETARKLLTVELKKLLRANPLIREKLSFPDLEPSRLQELLKKRQPDNTNLQSQAPVIDKPMQSAKESEDVIFMGANTPLEVEQMPVQTPIKGAQPLDCAMMASETPFSKAFSDPGLSGSKSSLNVTNDLPKIVVQMLDLGSRPTSIDFHPSKHTLLIVGTSAGEIEMWDVCSQEKIFSTIFKIWNKEGGSQKKSLSRIFSFRNQEKADVQKAYEGEVRPEHPSVNRVLWSPDGSLFGVAYSEDIVQLFCYCSRNSIWEYMELEAHDGSVNDLAFACPNDQHFIITCGDDATIKVFHLVTGAILYIFQGHKSPICCVVSSANNDLQVAAAQQCLLVLMVKGWFTGTIILLISCGTTKDGVSHLVEWHEMGSIMKRTIQGVNKCSFGVMQFDTAKNGLLVAGDDFSLKFWDLNAVDLVTPIDASEMLPASRLIRFNKEGTLLAVTANDNKIKILVSVNGFQLLQTNERVPCVPATVPKGEDKGALGAKEQRSPEKGHDGPIVGRFTELNEPDQFRWLRLPPHSIITSKILRLTYHHSGTSILALAADAIHLRWKWPSKATTSVHPRLLRNKFGEMMTNDVTDSMLDEAPGCFALTASDGYLLSSSGGEISLFNIRSFEKMVTFMNPPPAATYIAVHPWDNNVIAVGLDDSTIQIYNVRTSEYMHTSLVVWNSLSGGWERQRSRYLWIPNEEMRQANLMDTRVQFSQEQTSFLVVCQPKLAIYEAMTLYCVREWNVDGASSPISDATFSCDGRLVYASFLDGAVCIFMAQDLQIRCRISPSAYLPPGDRSRIYPLAVAAHPQKPNQLR